MSEERTKYCHQCGAMIPYKDRYCPACNAEQATLPGMQPVNVKNMKSPWTAMVLSFLVTGLGQLYLGERKRALAFFGGTLLLGGILNLSMTQDQVMGFGVLMAFISAVDAYRIAMQKRSTI